MKILAIAFLCCLAVTARAQPKQPSKTASSKPFVLGVIEELQSVELAEKRTLNIYLPEGYSPKDTTKYPVVYLLDGSANEDFIHVVGLYQFNNFPWINRVPKSIIVGIANTDRKRDFTYPSTIATEQRRYPTAGKSERFIAFMEKELQPYIEHKYKANQSKTLIGQSLAGLLATEILLTKPTLFNKYIIISPSLWWDDASLLKGQPELLQEGFKARTDIYLGVGKEGLGPSDIPHVMEVDANLLAEKIRSTKSKSVRFYFDYLPTEDHATITHQAIFNALRLLNPLPTK
ncbi:alpha/beta hydrolase [Hymenobacter sp. BT664]|uniref:Alpha/beta hydrolase n=1 Tax=Hymenobacter montanus TaxID=2771359 RepID=A0A927BGK1_9BACT|nr:alpha/beta hydrolase-fold protein [Hymenobacter montanus]MBD2770482.1 alpha/beta hydrolase [Hymenobacter montanus]